MAKPLASQLPRVLADPPWRRAAAAAAAGDRSAPPPPPSTALLVKKEEKEEAKALVWIEGERERFLGPAVKALSEVAEERLYNRLLDELDREQIVPRAELAKLGDEHLLDLAGELRAVHVDVAGLEHLLARLGEEFVNEAVAFVRVAPPERGLFEAMAPVRASILARTAASLFMHREIPDRETLTSRPFVKSPADAWLVRFADVAGPALAALDDRAARAALAWIAARGRADTIPKSHDSLIAPFTPLAKLAEEEPWIAFLAARGSEALALGLIDREEGTLLAARALAGNARSVATAWLEAHRDVAEPILRKASEEAAAGGGGGGAGADEASVALAVLGGDATAGDPKLDEVPTAIPALPAFFTDSELPAPRLNDGTKIGPDAMKALGEMLRFTSLARPYPGIAQVRGACDAASLDDFALAILNRWGEAGEPPTDLWALESAGKIGGDGCAREIARRIRIWSKGAEPPRHAWDDDERRVVMLNEGDRGWAYARAGCQVLAANGTDLALTLLDDLGRSGGTTWLRKEARRALDAVSEGRKLRPTDLADDIVPNLGLDDEGSTVLDLGPRTFKLTFDEMLTPMVIDPETHTASKTFPRSRKDDDPEKAAAAKTRFQGLAKDTKVLARQQVAQLEAAMCSRRAWTADAFRERFVAHPLLRHLARRLVWAYEDDLSTTASPEPKARGEAPKTFRIAEDLTFADDNDEAFEVHKSSRIILIHPILLTPELRTRWSGRFADYQLVQPLPQLEREIFTVTEEEHGQHQLARGTRELGEGTTTNRGRLFGLSRRGWSARVENGWIEEYFRVLPGGAHARIGITPGMAMGPGTDTDVEYTLTTVSSTYALDRLPPIDFSELVRDVAYLGAKD